MESYNQTNHNTQGNPHGQYDNNPYRFQYITPAISSDIGKTYGFNKVMEFYVSGHVYNMPENMRRNLSKHVYIEFDIKDLNTQGAVFKSNVVLDVLVNENSKTVPFVRAQHNFNNVNDAKDFFDRNVKIKQTLLPQYADIDGVYPAKFEVFISAPTYGKISIIPVNFINEIYTPDSAVPLGAIPSTISTTKQKFDDVIGNFVNNDPISETSVNSLLENQSLISVTVIKNNTIKTVPNGITKISDLCDYINSYSSDVLIREEYIAINNTMTDCILTDPYNLIKVYTRGKSRSYITVTDVTGNTATATYSNGVLGSWVLTANVSKTVPNYGTKTINGDTTIMSGNMGIRVLGTGIQKTSDGGTNWVNI